MTGWGFPARDEGWIEFTYQQQVTNGAGGAADITFAITPGVGTDLLIWGGELTNGDTVARNASIVISDGTNTVLTILAASSLNAAATTRWPYVGQAFAATGNNPQVPGPYPVSAPQVLTATMAAVALSQDATLSFLAWFRGAPPSVVPGGQAPLVLAGSGIVIAG